MPRGLHDRDTSSTAGKGRAATVADTATDGGGSREDARAAWNTLCLEIHQVIVRVGWIFKTETIIMPAVLDQIVDSGPLRGLLPVLNRGGQSITPLLFSGRLSRAPLKKWALMRSSALMAACFAILATAWTPLENRRPDLLALLFLVVYASFSSCNGFNQLVVAALQGKLIAPGNRGRAMLVSVSLGSVLAIGAALLWLGRWLGEANGFPKIFAATATFFGLAALVPPFLDEPREPDVRPSGHPLERSVSPGWLGVCRQAVDGWRNTLTADRNLVRLAVVAACFSAVLMLFPHYQAFARDRLGSRIGSLLTWVVVQNAATGAASLVVGPLSDRRGTRLLLIWLVALSSSTPLLVTALARLPQAFAVDWFWLVYVPLGLNPLSLRLFTNYALELAPVASEHPRYVSIVGAALAAPFVLSPLVGLAVERLGFEPVFVIGAVVIAVGAIVAVGLPEPRERFPEGRPTVGPRPQPPLPG
jgi:predicted MFS family arabinose efflux permease